MMYIVRVIKLLAFSLVNLYFVSLVYKATASEPKVGGGKEVCVFFPP